MQSVPYSARAGQLGVGDHVVRIASFAPAYYRLGDKWVLNRDSFGRTLYEVLFADDAGFTIRHWLALASLFRPDGSPSNYGALHVAAGLTPYDSHEDLAGCELRIAVGTDRRGKLVVAGMRAMA